ncbi:MAG: 50S ribosomal protein L32e [Nitrososphaeraceae archaeon]|nr:50S ribosomal protein L32e [Nitrososphaeraceae archaeon]
MVINKELLQLRKKIADKRPDFVRQESWRYKKLATNWRKPKGKDNKMRKQVSGVPALVKVGYKGPRKSRGLHPSGYNDVLIFNTNDLTRIDPKIDAIRIAHGVGYKKRLDILNEATKLKIKVLNPGKIEKVEKVETKPKKEVEKVEKEKAEVKPKKEVEKVEKEKAEVKPKKEVEKVEKEKAEVKPKKEKGKGIGKKVSKS